MIFFPIFARFSMRKKNKMKRIAYMVVAVLLCCFGCSQREENKELLQRDFYNTVWERFDYVTNDIEIKEAKTFDLSMKITFTDDYPYNDFAMNFTVFDDKGNPYRAKGYKFTLKDQDSQWKAQKSEDGYTFTLPINKRLSITEPGRYQFMIEQKQPITPLVGVKSLVLLNNE